MLKALRIFIIVAAISIIHNLNVCEVLAASTAETESKETEIEDAYVIKFMEAIKDRDTDSMLELWVGEESESTLKTFENLYRYWNGKEITSYKKTGEKKRPSNEEKKQPSGKEYEYEITSGSETVKLRFSITDEYKGGRYIDSFQFLNESQSAETIALYKKFELIKVCMKILIAAEILFSIAMFILCIKKKPKLWILWAAAILLVYGGITIGFEQKSTVTFGIFGYLLFFPQILLSSNGFILHLSLPLGAIAYCFVRKRLKKIPETHSDMEQHSGSSCAPPANENL